MLAQEKVPKEKGTPVHSSARTTRPLRSLAHAFLASPGARTTRDLAMLDSLRQGARLIPDWLRYSVSANGKGWLVLGVGFDFPHRLAQPSIAVKTG